VILEGRSPTRGFSDAGMKDGEIDESICGNVKVGKNR